MKSVERRITRLEEAYSERFLNSPEVAQFIRLYQDATREVVGDEGYARIAARILELAASDN